MNADSAISDINDYIKKNAIQKTYQEIPSTSTEINYLWNVHDHLVATKNDYNASNENICFELKQYLKQPLVERHENPLEYWSSMKFMYSSMYKLAIRYISIIGTSVPSERLFSQAGIIKTDSRSRLSGENLNKLLFLSSLAREDWG